MEAEEKRWEGGRENGKNSKVENLKKKREGKNNLFKVLRLS